MTEEKFEPWNTADPDQFPHQPTTEEGRMECPICKTTAPCPHRPEKATTEEDSWEAEFDKKFDSDRGKHSPRIVEAEPERIKIFIRQLLTTAKEEAKQEEVEEFNKWLWENGITHKECAQKLQRFIRSRTPNKS